MIVDWENEKTLKNEEKDDETNEAQDEEIEIVDIYGDITVRQFLLSKYKTGTGVPLFRFCFPVKYGMREFVVKTEHAQEAIDFCKVAKEDMLAYMTNDAPGMIFENVQDIVDRAVDHVMWEPYTMANEYEAIVLEKEEQAKPSRKRNKLDHGNTNKNNNTRQSYSNITRTKSSVNHSQKEQQNQPSVNIDRSEHEKKMANDILLLKEQIAILCKKQEE